MSIRERLSKMKQNKKGFTLVELIVVMVILAILTAILVPTMVKWIDKAKEKAVLVEARNAYMAVQTIASEAYGTDEVPSGMTMADYLNQDGSEEKAGGMTQIRELAEITDKDIEIKVDMVSGAAKVTGMTYRNKASNKRAILSSGKWTVEKDSKDK